MLNSFRLNLTVFFKLHLPISIEGLVEKIRLGQASWTVWSAYGLSHPRLQFEFFILAERALPLLDVWYGILQAYVVDPVHIASGSLTCENGHHGDTLEQLGNRSDLLVSGSHVLHPSSSGTNIKPLGKKFLINAVVHICKRHFEQLNRWAEDGCQAYTIRVVQDSRAFNIEVWNMHLRFYFMAEAKIWCW